MTPAPTMQTRSTLPREYLSAVTCQSTAAALDPAGEAPELGVGYEATLLRARALHGVEQGGEQLFGHVETELGDLDPDRVEAALLAEDDPALGAHEIGGVGLDRRRVLELRGDCAGLPREQVVSGHGLPGRELRSSELLHERAERACL